ncbi:GDSL-type esterase/lipase family protein [Botrimarina mediterranea]|uniref:GDSL-like Lipase/Acylhydrolase n=1 Tax=Botrimarina mediterranea TaxID=2528022 RepID=A0A518K5E8_9BACT|nr:GDSL-type esterase/lipase family protein [Botrimarina mediterranea]QDV73014.1 GDSL-like Lipase/Acylhydrolase [Botrimarina mediterranea]
MLKIAFCVAMVLGSASVGFAKDTPTEGMKLATTPDHRLRDRWWRNRHDEKLDAKKRLLDSDKEVRLVFVGDSITHGWENGGKQLWEERYAPRGAFNIGFSGDRTEHVLWRLGMGEAGKDNNEIAGLEPELFVVMIGTNNTGHRKGDPGATAKGVEMVVDRLLELAPESKVLLLAVFARGEKPDDELRQINDDVNERIAGLGERDNVEFLDINDVFLDDDGTLPKSVMPDLLHPNEHGYKLWADAIEEPIARLLGEK